MDRRNFLRALSLATGGTALALSGFTRRAEILAETNNFSELKAFGFGKLAPAAAKNTGETFLALPEGFEYNVIGKIGSTMADGQKTPPAHDGMATFQVGRETRIIRNHEVTGGRVPREGIAIGKNTHSDEDAGGGTTTLVINPRTN